MATFTGKQQAFINAYLGEANFNATRAAEIAGYKGNGNTLAVIGFDNLRKPNIADEIKKCLQASAMGKDELLMRLGDQARIDVSKYYNTEGGFEIKKFTEDGYGHLIKNVKPGRYGPIVEFHDALKSQELIGKHLALFVDKSEVIEINGGSLVDFEEWKKTQSDRQDEAEETLEQFEGSDSE